MMLHHFSIRWLASTYIRFGSGYFNPKNEMVLDNPKVLYERNEMFTLTFLYNAFDAFNQYKHFGWFPNQNRI